MVAELLETLETPDDLSMPRASFMVLCLDELIGWWKPWCSNGRSSGPSPPIIIRGPKGGRRLSAPPVTVPPPSCSTDTASGIAAACVVKFVSENWGDR